MSPAPTRRCSAARSSPGCSRPIGRRSSSSSNAEPLSLFCADESDGESLRACEQTNESLYRYDGAKSVPALATECKPSADSKTWTCKLRDGVKFHDGAALDANDVVVSYALQWDTKQPAAQGPRQRVRLLAGPVGRLPQSEAAGNAGTGNAKAVSVSVLRQRFRSDDMVGAPHPRRPRLTRHRIAPVWMTRR